MVRSVVVAKENVLSIEVPDSYIGKKVEIIAFAADEEVEGLAAGKGKKTKKFLAVKLDTKGYKFNRDEANER